MMLYRRMGVVLAGLAAGAGLLSGCSSQSKMNLTITRMYESGSSGKPWIEADVYGAKGAACLTVQEPAEIEIANEAPGTLGPSLDSMINRAVVEYFYFNPNSGNLEGPTKALTLVVDNLAVRVTAGATAQFTLPIATLLMKRWCYNINCASAAYVPGFPGPGFIERLVARVTLSGKDSTAKVFSTTGSISVYLYDYGPAPSGPPFLCPPVTGAAAAAFLCP